MQMERVDVLVTKNSGGAATGETGPTAALRVGWAADGRALMIGSGVVDPRVPELRATVFNVWLDANVT